MKFFLNEPVGVVARGLVNGVGGSEQLILALVKIHQVDDHAALIRRGEEALQTAQPFGLEGTIRKEGADMGAVLRAVAIAVRAVEPINLMIVARLPALQGHVYHSYSRLLEKIEPANQCIL